MIYSPKKTSLQKFKGYTVDPPNLESATEKHTLVKLLSNFQMLHDTDIALSAAVIFISRIHIFINNNFCPADIIVLFRAWDEIDIREDVMT